MNDNTSISILKDTKRKLDKYKKKYGTYEGVISSFVTYFETTNINPNDISLNPTSLVKDGTERMIKIFRNIELKKIDKILRQVEYIGDKFEAKNKPNLTPELSSNNDSGLTTDQITEMAEKLVDFEQEITSKNTEILNLNKRLVEVNNSSETEVDDSFNSIFLDIKNNLDELWESQKPSGFSGNDVKFDKGVLKRHIDACLILIKNR